MLKNTWAFRFTITATFLALIVILLGAYTRLKDAGLGCPDWPGCYGQLTIPNPHTPLINTPFAGRTVDPNKTWPEMTHRYAAATLALLSFAAAILILHQRKLLPKQAINIAFALLILLFFQGLLGKWTVTLRLHPIVVISHLLGGLALLSLLWILILRLTPLFRNEPTYQETTLRRWAGIGLLIIILQISLGGWTSANYAAFICPDFPLCQGQWWPKMNFSEGFHGWLTLNKNFQGGVLSSTARTAIQITHRIGALITAIYLSFLIWKIFTICRKGLLHFIAIIIFCLLIIQIGLGILNVIWALPLPIAIAHNGTAALLLLSLITLNVYLNEALRPVHSPPPLEQSMTPEVVH